MSQRRGGIIQLQIDGEVYRAKGSFSYNLGRPMREALVGADSVHGYKETPQVAYVEGEITDGTDIDLDSLVSVKDATVTLTLANGKIIAVRDAYYAADGVGNSEEGNIAVRFEGEAEEVTP